MSSPVFGVGGSGTSLTVHSDEYDPGITEEIDHQIRNLPICTARCLKSAKELLKRTGSNNFEIVLSTERGAEVYERMTDAMGSRYVGRKLRWNARTSKWGDNIGETSRSAEKQRPRAYVCPANNVGIHEELTRAVLLKAAMGMSGQ